MFDGERFEYTQRLKDITTQKGTLTQKGRVQKGKVLVTRYLVDGAIWRGGVLVRYELIDQSGETVVRDSKVLHKMLSTGRLRFF